jgi:hypothetical protein
MVSNMTQHPPPPTTHTLSVYRCIYCTFTRGGGLTLRDGWRGYSSQSWVENTNMTGCIYTVDTASHVVDSIVSVYKL